MHAFGFDSRIVSAGIIEKDTWSISFDTLRACIVLPACEITWNLSRRNQSSSLSTAALLPLQGHVVRVLLINFIADLTIVNREVSRFTWIDEGGRNENDHGIHDSDLPDCSFMGCPALRGFQHMYGRAAHLSRAARVYEGSGGASLQR